MGATDVTPGWAVLPVKPFDWAKSRLDGVLPPPARADLARRLMLGSLRALLDSGCFERVVVVSCDAEALAMAGSAGAYPLTEDAPADLNAALASAQRLAEEHRAASLLVLASDLPLVQPGDIRRIVAAAETSDAVIVPDRRREGTNALLLRPPGLIDFAFGQHSFPRHRERIAAAGHAATVLTIEAIAFDIDLPADLRELEGGAVPGAGASPAHGEPGAT